VSHAVKIDPEVLAGLFARWNRTDEPGLVVGVSHPGAGSWRAGYGLASLELPVVNTPRTRMRIGSTSKMFTCLAMLLLQEEGKLSIDDPVRKYLPELPDWADGMTARHFMTHTSGMRCHLDVLYLTGNLARPAPAETALEFLKRQKGVNFPVGERWSYNNAGYNMLSLIVERVSGQDFGKFQDERIYQPLGMIDTAVKRSDNDMLPNSASLHQPHTGGRFERGFFGVSISGEGAMVSSVEDMLIWLKHMHRPVVGGAESWRQIKTPALLNDGRNAGYGLGLSRSDYRGLTVLYHAGGVFGGVCMCLTVPELELDVIIIANRGDAPVQPLGYEVIDACVEGLVAPAEPRDGSIPAGLFWSDRIAAPLEVAEEDGQLTAKLWDATIPMARDGDGRIVCTLPMLDLAVSPVGGDPDGVTVDMRGSADLFRRIDPGTDDPMAEAGRLAGRYRCEEAEATADIAIDAGLVSVRMSGPFGRDTYAMSRRSPLIWISNLDGSGHGGVMEFTIGDGGAITGFALTSARTRRVAFERLA
jgi:D-aminopeptidase